MFKKLFILITIGLSIFLTTRALFHEGFFRTIDDVTPVRLSYMAKELASISWLENFPVRFSADLSHGYGYPLYLFYGPLVYYIGGLLMLLAHLSDIVAAKAVYAFPLIIGPILMYWASRQKLGRWGALTATLLYAFFPFRGFDAYLRGGVGEGWSMAFLPAAMGGLFLIEKKNRWGIPITAIFLALAIISHNISGLLILGLLLAYGLYSMPKNKSFWVSLLLGLGISAFFWLPSLYYMNIVKVNYSAQNTGEVLNHLSPLRELITPHSYRLDEKSSPYLLYLLILGFFLTYNSKKKNLIWLIASLIIFFLPSMEMKWLWSLTLPLSRLTQFPWRIYIIGCFTIPLAIGYFINNTKSKFLKLLFFVVLIPLYIMYLPAFSPREYSYFYNYNAEDTGPCATSWGDEYIPIWVKECISAPYEKIMYTKPELDFTIQKTNNYSYQTTLQNDSSVMLYANKYYFPGWKVMLDGREANIDHTFYKHGIFRTEAPAGVHSIRLIYQKTWIMWLADLLTLLSLLIILKKVVYAVKKTN
ncbi:MAG: hypothetical protein ABII21_04255 [bacterium]